MIDLKKLTEAARAAMAVLRGEQVEPARSVIQQPEVISYPHIDKASPYGRALEGLGSAVSRASMASTPQRAVEIIAEAVEAAETSTLVVGKPVMLVAALREGAAFMGGRRWGDYVDRYEAEKAAEAEAAAEREGRA